MESPERGFSILVPFPTAAFRVANQKENRASKSDQPIPTPENYPFLSQSAMRRENASLAPEMSVAPAAVHNANAGSAGFGE
jgi:hypothetical protein